MKPKVQYNRARCVVLRREAGQRELEAEARDRKRRVKKVVRNVMRERATNGGSES